MSKGKCKRCCRSCYNKEDKTCCGKTFCSWIKVILYYLIFMILLLLLLLFIVQSVTESNTENPTMKKHSLYTHAAPGTGFLPTSADKFTDRIIYYTKQKPSNVYTDAISNFLAKQKARCKRIDITGYRTCAFHLEDLGPCAKPDYGYKNKTPCLFLKLNKLLSWMPFEYNSRNELTDIPEPLRSQINISRPCVWVHCSGITDYDNDHLGRIDYYPERAFHERYFPFEKGVEINPVVAIQFPKISPGYLLRVTCSVFAKNMERRENAKVTSFVYIDK